ncbi:unnamed protein product, partial [Rotaria sp. Silwood2]
SIYSTDQNPEDESSDQNAYELHPFTYISIKDAMVEFLRLIPTSQINMNTLLGRLGTADYFYKKTICILCEKELEKD